MKRFRDATVVSSAHDASALARYVETFADASADWAFPAEKSAQYEEMSGGPACCVVTASNSLPRAAVHLMAPSERARSLGVTNIVPLVAYELSVDEYNAVLEAFVRALRARARFDGVPLRVTLTKGDVRLADVVTGEVPWKLLQRYLATHPLSGHPLDIERLDVFICALSRYARKRFDADAFEVLLMEELGWSKRDAHWCRARVEVGLEVLAVNKTYRG